MLWLLRRWTDSQKASPSVASTKLRATQAAVISPTTRMKMVKSLPPGPSGATSRKPTVVRVITVM